MNFINEVLSKNFINNQQILSICAKKKKLFKEFQQTRKIA